MAHKPWLTAKEQIGHLENLGVRFEQMSKDEAVSYLTNNSNYFRIKSFRSGFKTVRSGAREGQYENLDFAMLVDLSVIDMLLRYEMLPMALDIEHFAKVQLLREIESHNEDGYEIVQGFISSSDSFDPKTNRKSNYVKSEIDRTRKSEGERAPSPDGSKYEYPAWSFIEMVSFGSICRFYKYCSDRFDEKSMNQFSYQLLPVKTLRNACAHNHCIINSLSAKTACHKTDYAISDAISKISGIGSQQRRSRMSNEWIQSIASTLYLHKTICSAGVVDHRSTSLATFKSRMLRHVDYYQANTDVSSTFLFLGKVIDAWYPTDVLDDTKTGQTTDTEPTH